MRPCIYLLLMPFVFWSCSSGETQKAKKGQQELPYHIDLTKSPDRDLFLSDFADEINYIPLESNGVIVGGSCTVKFGKEFFIISDRDQGLLAFSLTGKFLNKIGMVGNGPMEFPSVSPDFQVESATNEILIPIYGKEANTYDIKGQFRRKIKFPEFRPHAIIMANSRIYISRREPPTDRYIRIEVFRPDGKQIDEYAFRLPDLDGRPICSPYTELSLTPDNDVIVNSFCHDTTFMVTAGGEWKPYIVYNRGTGKIPESATFFQPRWDEFPDNFYPMYLKDLGRIIVMANVNGKGGYFCFFIKRTGEFFRFNMKISPDEPDYRCIQNDLDGGPGLAYHHTSSGHYLYCVHQAIDLIEWKKSGHFDRIEAKFPDKKKELFAMIDSLKPDDNPVIMIVKIKE